MEFALGIALLALVTATFLSLRAAKRAAGCLRQASEFSQRLRRWSEIEAEMSELRSSFERLLESHKRLRSREGMAELRARRREEQQLETKAQARARIFGTAAGPEFARRQLDIARDARSD